MATPSRTKKIMFTALAGLGVTAGAAGIAAAATTQTTPTDPSAAEQSPAEKGTNDAAEKDDTPKYTSSVTVPQTPEGAEGAEESDAAEAAKLAPLAKISADEASKAATTAVPGTAATPELEEEDGNVVYDVEIITADGKQVEVIIDAGNGKVLAQETDNDHEGKDANEANETGTETGTETPAPAATAPNSTPGN